MGEWTRGEIREIEWEVCEDGRVRLTCAEDQVPGCWALLVAVICVYLDAGVIFDWEPDEEDADDGLLGLRGLVAERGVGGLVGALRSVEVECH